MHGCSKFFLTGFFEPGFNSSNMVLIPKMPSTLEICHYRPIVLSNFIYKVITKILVNRLSSITSRFFPTMNLDLFKDGTFNFVWRGPQSSLMCFNLLGLLTWL